MTRHDPKLATRLKNEGNILFQREKFAAADTKYTKALDAEPSNASIWCNRAACRLKTKRYLDAASDATKATKLDPEYSKAWARAGQAHDALGQPMHSFQCWEQAVQTRRSKDNLTSDERNQLLSYEESLAKAKKALYALQNPQSKTFQGIIFQAQDPHPWVLAMDVLPQLAKGQSSSAKLISNAYHELQTGLSMLSMLRVEGHRVFGKMGTVEQISNAILKDQRCFHIADNKFLENYRIQSLFEANVANAWKFEGPDAIKKEAIQRQRRDGWEHVKIALSTTIRCWIMLGFLDGGLRGNRAGQVEYIGNAVEIIKWGREVWEDVPRENRGAIFEETFLRGVQNLLLDAKLAMFNNVTDRRAEFLEKLFAEANEVIRGVDSAVVPPYDGEDGPEFRMAFYDYPKATAYSMKGLYYREKAQQACNAQDRMKLYERSGDMYVRAAGCLPDDDENYIVFLTFAVGNLKEAHVKISTIIELMERIKAGLPKMRKIWQYSSMSRQGRDNYIDAVLDLEKDLRNKLARGVVNT
ncbi:hypothetical protein D9758_005557 [Tetrapyrgos nigripes]|uniref:TPR-like protein n=1 Tax=Tetrapyrgos nigripes TaxID=182062 RepID=A0A8H5GGZ2_9AGAR|nr:hypothetical protein D9758_005557 [Tetrapyrgos nigripes]